MKKISSVASRVAVITGLALGAFVMSALASDPPAGGPPACPTTIAACNPPINTGDGDQQKTGVLTLKSLIYNPTLTQNSVTSGYVLTADGDDGVVKWASPGQATLSCGPVVPTEEVYTGYVEVPLINACTTTGGCRLQVIRDGVNIDGKRTIRYIQGASGLSGNNWVGSYGDNGTSGTNGITLNQRIGAGMGDGDDYEFYDDSEAENTTTSISFRDRSNDHSYSVAICP